jgi:hypothetical protein
VDGSCEHGTEPAVSIKLWNFLELLHKCRIPENGLAPQSYFIIIININIIIVAITIIIQMIRIFKLLNLLLVISIRLLETLSRYSRSRTEERHKNLGC